MEQTFDGDGIRGVLHLPDKPGGDGLALTHGAGSDSNTVLLISLAEAFAAAGLVALRYDLPFRVAGGNPFPAGQARDRAGVQSAVAELRKHASGRIFAAGHSYGGRMTAMAAAEHPEMADGLLLLSYPLHPPRKPEQVRTAFFPELRTPAIFVHGTRDPFGSVEELQIAIRQIPARTEILPVERSGHDLKAAAKMGEAILGRMLS